MEVSLETASGFLFLSGLVSGLVAFRRGAEGDFQTMAVPFLRRAGVIWMLHVGLLAGATVMKPATGRPDLLPAFASGTEALQFLGSAALLQSQPMYFDILPLYVVLVALVSVLVVLVRRSAAWVLAGSAMVWALAGARLIDVPWAGATFGGSQPFDPLSWQVLFVIGFVMGSKWQWVREQLRGRRGLQASVFGVFAVLALLATMHRGVLGGWMPDGLRVERSLFTQGHEHCAALLIPYAVSACLAGWMIVDRMGGTWLRDWSTRWLGVLGRQSLAAFVIHLVLVLLMAWVGTATWPMAGQGVATVAAIGAVVLAVRAMDERRARPAGVALVAQCQNSPSGASLLVSSGR